MLTIDLLNKLHPITEEEFNEAMKETQDARYKEFWKHNGISQIPLRVGYEKPPRQYNE